MPRSCLPLLAVALAALPGCASPALETTTEVPADPAIRAGSTAVVAPGLRFVPDPGWVPLPVQRTTRLAEFRLPAGADATGDAGLVIYHFGRGGAGTVAENLDRWIGQIEPADGRSAREAAHVTTGAVHGLQIDAVDVAGTYVAETRPGSGERVHRPDSRLLGAVVETPAGPYYLKLVGPAATVARWKPSWDTLLASVRPHDADAPTAAGTAHP